jgi:hypothetical protein
MSKMSYDPIKIRGEIRRSFTVNGVLKCAWCGDPITGSFDPHHALVKSSSVKHWAIDESICNRVPLHRICHSEHGQSAEMKVKALDYLIERLGAERIGLWYVSLWREHGLSVAQGSFPVLRSDIPTEQEWREYLQLVILPL